MILFRRQKIIAVQFFLNHFAIHHRNRFAHLVLWTRFRADAERLPFVFVGVEAMFAAVWLADEESPDMSCELRADAWVTSSVPCDRTVMAER